MTDRVAFDEETAKRLEGFYGTRDVLRRRRLVREALGARSGERILDVGCGPGFYVAEILDEVGPSCSVVGADPSAATLAVAARRTEGRPNVEFHEADATSLPVGDASFDGAVSVQVLEYVPDATGALTEINRALRRGGRVVIWDVDWSSVSWHSSDQQLMDRVLRAWDEHLVHPSLPRTLGACMRSAGFGNVTFDAHVFSTSERSREAYGGAWLVSTIADFVAGRGGVTAEEAHAWKDDLRAMDERGEYFFSCVQYCFMGTKPAIELRFRS